MLGFFLGVTSAPFSAPTARDVGTALQCPLSQFPKILPVNHATMVGLTEHYRNHRRTSGTSSAGWGALDCADPRDMALQYRARSRPIRRRGAAPSRTVALSAMMAATTFFVFVVVWVAFVPVSEAFVGGIGIPIPSGVNPPSSPFFFLTSPRHLPAASISPPPLAARERRGRNVLASGEAADQDANGSPARAKTKTIATTPRGSTRSRTLASMISSSEPRTPVPRTKKTSLSSTSLSSASMYSAAPSSPYFLERSLLRHPLLTKAQELRLGRAVQRAQIVRRNLEALLPESSSPVEALGRGLAGSEEDEVDDDDDEEDDDDEDYDDDDDETSSRLSWAYRVGTYAEDDEYQDQRRLSLLADQERRRATQEGDDNIVDGDDVLSSHPWTDAELESVGVSGGRAGLRRVLRQGSLARQTLIRSNVRLVVSIAKRWFQPQWSGSDSSASMASAYAGTWDRPSLDEVVQEGIVGLATAVDRFDPQRNLRFSTYATFWCTNSIRRCFQTAAMGPVRVPVQYLDVRTRYVAHVRSYLRQHGSTPPLEAAAQSLGLTASRLAYVLRMTQPRASLDAPMSFGPNNPASAGKAGSLVNLDKSNALTETLVDPDKSPEERAEWSLLRQSLEDALAAELAPQERDVLRLRLGLDDGVTRTTTEVVRVFGDRISASQVRSWERQAYKKLRAPHSLYHLWSFLDLAGVDRSTSTLP